MDLLRILQIESTGLAKILAGWWKEGGIPPVFLAWESGWMTETCKEVGKSGGRVRSALRGAAPKFWSC